MGRCLARIFNFITFVSLDIKGYEEKYRDNCRW